MTIGIAGPGRRAPRRNVVVALLTIAIVVATSLILLGFTGAILVDWMWFSAIGYLQVFWTTIGTIAAVFFVVFGATAVIVWANIWFALNFAQRPRAYHAGFDWKLTAVETPSGLVEFTQHRCAWHH